MELKFKAQGTACMSYWFKKKFNEFHAVRFCLIPASKNIAPGYSLNANNTLNNIS